MAERAGVVAGLKVAAFIRWAFSEGTNDRGGRRRKDTAARRSRRSSRRSRTCRERGRRKRTFCLTLSKSFSHPDNDFARSRAPQWWKMKIPAFANVLREAHRRAAKSLLSRQ